MRTAHNQLHSPTHVFWEDQLWQPGLSKDPLDRSLWVVEMSGSFCPWRLLCAPGQVVA